ncbi:hypothetical protein FQR65_LT16355 [Abscondita terminalis]|nr:hypothetical protein FQR65_LT16355 [Abscondita terminalis]
MKNRRKKELAAEKIERMATGGGSYKPPADSEDAVIDDIFSSVDIELKDVIDSDTILMVGASDVRPTTTTKTKKRSFTNRGSAIEMELKVRMARTQRATEQDEELHRLLIEEQKIRIEIAKEILKQEKIKTEKMFQQQI